MNSAMTVDEYGNKFWRNAAGELHSEDGPAFEYANGHKAWYFNDEELTEQDFNNKFQNS